MRILVFIPGYARTGFYYRVRMPGPAGRASYEDAGPAYNGGLTDWLEPANPPSWAGQKPAWPIISVARARLWPRVPCKKNQSRDHQMYPVIKTSWPSQGPPVFLLEGTLVFIRHSPIPGRTAPVFLLEGTRGWFLLQGTRATGFFSRFPTVRGNQAARIGNKQQ